ncbi:hypothetical protein D3C77_393060 [compost metagenome]
MNLWTRYILALLLFVATFLFTDYLELSRILSFLIAFGVILLVFLPSFYVLLFGSDIKKIEKVLISYRDEPVFNLYLALANNDNEEVEYCIEAILNKHKARHKQALYKTILALYKKEILSAKEEIKLIKPLIYQNYYQAFLYIEEGNTLGAIKLIDTLPKQWMRDILLSEIKFRSGQYDEALKLGRQALEQVRGITKYSAYKSYQKQLLEYGNYVS